MVLVSGFFFLFACLVRKIVSVSNNPIPHIEVVFKMHQAVLSLNSFLLRKSVFDDLIPHMEVIFKMYKVLLSLNSFLL